MNPDDFDEFGELPPMGFGSLNEDASPPEEMPPMGFASSSEPPIYSGGFVVWNDAADMDRLRTRLATSERAREDAVQSQLRWMARATHHWARVLELSTELATTQKRLDDALRYGLEECERLRVRHACLVAGVADLQAGVATCQDCFGEMVPAVTSGCERCGARFQAEIEATKKERDALRVELRERLTPAQDALRLAAYELLDAEKECAEAEAYPLAMDWHERAQDAADRKRVAIDDLRARLAALDAIDKERRSNAADGWTGHSCPRCNGCGEANDGRPCPACGGTGDEYVSD